ncbi:hypothetical protein QO009_004110 [Brevibacillus aydinogluensis]|jgi:hypothetical protein|uniref:hypothetical protein n=1 Tax=Brevibacillus aydinogluensis TaxID=927786 RepID=UPI0028932D9F|nr:hypothetical protein [Brevibacillus aydinogluensis]MDT3418185.1 hypothetical protein [Brevibacillus aydinogluensis]
MKNFVQKVTEYQEFTVGGKAEIVSTSFDDDQRTFYKSVGDIIDIQVSQIGQVEHADLRLRFGDGYETWIPAEDCAVPW